MFRRPAQRAYIGIRGVCTIALGALGSLYLSNQGAIWSGETSFLPAWLSLNSFAGEEGWHINVPQRFFQKQAFINRNERTSRVSGALVQNVRTNKPWQLWMFLVSVQSWMTAYANDLMRSVLLAFVRSFFRWNAVVWNTACSMAMQNGGAISYAFSNIYVWARGASWRLVREITCRAVITPC